MRCPLIFFTLGSFVLDLLRITHDPVVFGGGGGWYWWSDQRYRGFRVVSVVAGWVVDSLLSMRVSMDGRRMLWLGFH
ncbi:hypothetical protein BJ742DRAFT_833128 [Cladochytrium replicatum]|nr:hypothetical protein BJ742DRAFT_833128 [Cladochytrium replicatum]